MKFTLYTQLIYNSNDLNLNECLDILTNIYKYLYTYMHMLYEPIGLSLSTQKLLYNIINYINKYRHQNDILNIFKHCINIIKIQIKYKKLQIYHTDCGKIIIMQDILYDCSLRKYIYGIYNKIIGE